MATDGEILVNVAGVSKKFCRSLKKSLWYGMKDLAAEAVGGKGRHGALRDGEFWAVKDVSFELRRGECLGLIGRNGAGKTTLLKMLNGLIKPDTGRIEMRGRVGALIALGAGFNPILTGRENIYVNGSVLGLSQREIEAKLEEIIDFADIRDFIDTPVQSYSSGMQVRLGYSVAASLKPDILLVDEVLAVGDAAFQRKCMASMQDYVAGGGSLILVAHNMHAIQSVCSRCAVLNGGSLKFLGPTPEGVNVYYSMQVAEGAGKSGERPRAKPTEANPVIIEDVRVSSLDGGKIVTGRPMRVTLRYVSLRAVKSVAWGISIWTGDLHVRVATATSSWNAITPSLSAGEGVLECVIPDVPLLTNSYFLKAGIYDAGHAWPIARIGWEDAPVQFAVESPPVESYNRQVASGDLIVLKAEWANGPEATHSNQTPTHAAKP